MSQHSSTNNSYLLPIALLAIVILSLLGISIFVLTPKIQTNLAEQIQKELIDNKIPAEITLSGRDVTLRGVVSNIDEIEKAEAITKKICGIRFVDNQLLTDKPENMARLAKNRGSTKESLSESKSMLGQTTNPEKKIQPELKIDNSSKQGNEIEEIIEAELKTTKKEEITTVRDTETLANTLISARKKITDLPGKESVESTISSEPVSSSVNESKNATDARKSPVVSSNLIPPEKTENDNKTEVKTSTEDMTGKRKLLDYNTMLTAMIAYNKQKGRNPDRRLGRNLKRLDIQFKTDKEILEQNTTLDDLAESLKKNKRINIIIMVSAKTSQLAIDRAKSIQNYLNKKGIDLKRITISGKSGEESVKLEEISDE